jgi:hypothetical protein
MTTKEDIDRQLDLLQAHRQTLHHYLKQQAQLGQAHAPPVVTHGITEARAQIHYIKETLRGWGVMVEDDPYDKAADQTADEQGTDRVDRPSEEKKTSSKRKLREAICDHFALEELNELCVEIEEDLQAAGIKLVFNLEVVGGQTKSAKVLNLIGYLERRGYLDFLIRAVRRARPSLIL